jgi:hypothetical protein
MKIILLINKINRQKFIQEIGMDASRKKNPTSNAIVIIEWQSLWIPFAVHRLLLFSRTFVV